MTDCSWRGGPGKMWTGDGCTTPQRTPRVHKVDGTGRDGGCTDTAAHKSQHLAMPFLPRVFSPRLAQILDRD